jgi:TonB family protein
MSRSFSRNVRSSALVSICLYLTFLLPASFAQESVTEWKEFAPDKGGFSISMPGTPRSQETTVNTDAGAKLAFTYGLVHQNSSYLVVYSDIVSQPPGPDLAQRMLEGGIEEMMATNKTLVLDSRKDITFGEHPGREFVTYNENVIMKGRTLMVKGRLYILLFSMMRRFALKSETDKPGPQNFADRFTTDSSRFLDSFKLTPLLGEVDTTLGELSKRNVLVMGTKDGSDTLVGEKITDGVLNGRAVTLVQPPYPAIARSARASGKVSVQIIIDYDGNVLAAEVKDGHPLLWGASLKAARASKFTPTTLDGKPVMVSGIIVYNFVAQ